MSSSGAKKGVSAVLKIVIVLIILGLLGVVGFLAYKQWFEEDGGDDDKKEEDSSITGNFVKIDSEDLASGYEIDSKEVICRKSEDEKCLAGELFVAEAMSESTQFKFRITSNWFETADEGRAFSSAYTNSMESESGKEIICSEIVGGLRNSEHTKFVLAGRTNGYYGEFTEQSRKDMVKTLDNIKAENGMEYFFKCE